jgi:energy-coupling factor transport system ATP-binding protein
MMAGLLSPVAGTIVREDIVSSLISLQFPEHHITGTTVAEECLSWGLDSTSVLSSVHLMDKQDRAPLSLSRGELKRLHLACVLEKKCDLLLLDEPFGSLDASEKERVCRQISQKTSGITILFTHEQTTFPRVDHLWEIEQGQLSDCGEMPDALFRWHHAPALIKKLISSGRILNNISPEDLEEAVCRT